MKEEIGFTWIRGNIQITPHNQGDFPITYSFPIEADWEYNGVGIKWKFSKSEFAIPTDASDEETNNWTEAIKIARKKLKEMFEESVHKYHQSSKTLKNK